MNPLVLFFAALVYFTSNPLLIYLSIESQQEFSVNKTLFTKQVVDRLF